MEQTIAEILGGAAVIVLIFVAKKISGFIGAKVKMINDEHLRNAIMTLATAAEQMYKLDDPTGEIRKEYVELGIEKLGYQISEYISSLIESCVFEINKTNKEEYFDDDWTDVV